MQNNQKGFNVVNNLSSDQFAILDLTVSLVANRCLRVIALD